MFRYFKAQISRAGVMLPKADIERLADDLVGLAGDEFDAADPTTDDAVGLENCEAAWLEWLRRVGGAGCFASSNHPPRESPCHQ